MLRRSVRFQLVATAALVLALAACGADTKTAAVVQSRDVGTSATDALDEAKTATTIGESTTTVRPSTTVPPSTKVPPSTTAQRSTGAPTTVPAPSVLTVETGTPYEWVQFRIVPAAPRVGDEIFIDVVVVQPYGQPLSVTRLEYGDGAGKRGFMHDGRASNPPNGRYEIRSTDSQPGWFDYADWRHAYTAPGRYVIEFDVTSESETATRPPSRATYEFSVLPRASA